MKRINKFGGIIILVLAALLSTTSCKKDKVAYQTKVRNSCYNELLGLPFMKYKIVELTLGDKKFTDIESGSDSEYLDIESDTDYKITIKYETWFYNSDTGNWDYDDTFTDDLGTETWSDTEDGDKFIIKVKIGDVLQAYKPIYEVFIAV